MLNDTHVPDAHCSIEDCGKIFIVVTPGGLVRTDLPVEQRQPGRRE